MEIVYFSKTWPIPDQESLEAFLQEMATDVTKIGADSSTHARRLDQHQAVLSRGLSGGAGNLGPLAALALAQQPAPVGQLPATGSTSTAQTSESDAPVLGTQVILDTQAVAPSVEALPSGASLGTSGTCVIGTANTLQKMSDTAHVIAITLGSSASNGTIGYVATVRSGKQYPIGRVPIVNVGQNKLGIKTLQSAITQDVSGYIHYPLYIPGTLITGTDEIPVTMIA